MPQRLSMLTCTRLVLGIAINFKQCLQCYPEGLLMVAVQVVVWNILLWGNECWRILRVGKHL